MVANAVDLKKITNQLRHVSRMAVLLRLTRRAADAGSTQAKIVMAEIQAAFIRRGTAGGRSDLPSWANCLAREWRRLEKLVHTEVAAAWSKELNQLCEPLSIAEARTLEQAVSSSFREDHNRPLNRWESKVRHALNLALWSHVSFDEADKIENILRPYNPSQPERTVQAVRNPITDQLMAAVKSADFSTVLGKGETLLLNYHDVAVRPDEERTNHLEVLCVLQPASKKKGFFPPTPAQTFRSSESPNPIMDPAPVETCYRLLPEVVFFGHFTPSVPLPFFKMLVGAKDEDFVRHVWRWSRRDTTPRFGQPEREGCSLSVARTAIEIPSGHKLTWIVWLDGELVAFVDENNNSLL
jgi:hypothetical protein